MPSVEAIASSSFSILAEVFPVLVSVVSNAKTDRPAVSATNKRPSGPNARAPADFNSA